MLGSIISGLAPTIGGALGAATGLPGGGWLGAAGGSLLNNWFNSGSKPSQQPQQQMAQNPAMYEQLQNAQMRLLNQLQQQPQFQPVDINPMLQGVRQDFDQQVVPSIMERFSGMGQGGQRSSSFRNALGAAGSGLAQKLAELQTGHARDQQSQMMQHRGQNLQQMGLLGNFANQQNMLNQNQNQFNQQQANTAPYWLNPVISSVGSGLGALGNLWSGSQNRGLQGELGQQSAVNNAQNVGVGRQYETRVNPAQPGAINSAPDAAIGMVKAYLGLR